MRHMAVWTLTAAAACAVNACRREQSPRPLPPRAARLAAVFRFQPPPDGHLTEAQLDRYLRVRHSSAGRSDLQAARSAGVDPDEYAWVRARVIEALVSLDSHKVRSASEETYAKTIASLKKARQSARDRETQKTLDEQIAGLERERAGLKQVDAAPISVTLNAKLIARRRAEIEALTP
ncbi:MAG TPA: hypothetical protein VKJ00_10085 [Thermoanaerobaculia bacterium]|nr:hypothetical protein [Thermoanaerobaculia bacterium]